MKPEQDQAPQRQILNPAQPVLGWSKAGWERTAPFISSSLTQQGSCLSTGLEMKFKSGAYVTAFWQGDKLGGVRGPQMDALKEGRCLLDCVPLH